MHPYGHLSIVYNTIESNLCPLTDKWIKEDVVLICNAVLFRYIKELKEELNLIIYNNMKGAGGILLSEM